MRVHVGTFSHTLVPLRSCAMDKVECAPCGAESAGGGGRGGTTKPSAARAQGLRGRPAGNTEGKEHKEPRAHGLVRKSQQVAEGHPSFCYTHLFRVGHCRQLKMRTCHQTVTDVHPNWERPKVAGQGSKVSLSHALRASLSDGSRVGGPPAPRLHPPWPAPWPPPGPAGGFHTARTPLARRCCAGAAAHRPGGVPGAARRTGSGTWPGCQL
jgi:hypothetical protein